MFDDAGYYIPDVLFDETLFGHPEKSPLAFKNSGLENFNILIKTYIMKTFATETENHATLVENTEESLHHFMDYYLDTMLSLKNKYNRLVGTGNFDMLSSFDVYEVFSNIGDGEENGIPLIFSMEQYEEILTMTSDLHQNTEEIAYHMNQMSKDFEDVDSLLAQWLQY